jgi:hypothetical protein
MWQAERRKMLRSYLIIYLLTLCAFCAAPASAQAETYRWQTGQEGGRAATVSLLSTNTLSTGNRAIEYHPVLTIGCRAGQPASWTQSLRLREATAEGGSITVSVRIDGGGAQAENWTLGRNRSLLLDGGESVARLLDARQLSLSWSTGFFSGTGNAVFQLAGVKEAVTRLARACGIDLP